MWHCNPFARQAFAVCSFRTRTADDQRQLVSAEHLPTYRPTRDRIHTLQRVRRTAGTLGLTLALLFSLSTSNVSAQPRVIGGAPVSLTEQESRGLVRVGGGCSGVLLSNDTVLTAGHCVDNVQNPRTLVVTANWGSSGSQTRTGRAIYKFADFRSERNADLALVYLTSPLQVNGSTSGYNVQLNLDTPESMANANIAVFGVGFNVLPNNGFGTWRTASLKVWVPDGKLYIFPPNSNGQITAPGDSGGPDFIGVKLTGIHSGAQIECSNNMTPATCRATITKITSAFSVSIPAMKGQLQAVRATNWDPTRTTYWLDVFADEINGTGFGWSGEDNVNDVDWGQAFRAANEMCFNRGFVGGHFSGHNVLERDAHGLVCGGPGAIWYDATLAEVQNTGYGFTDTNLVHWALANRAATTICEGFQRGYVGGHFNGHQADGRFGLICYSAGAQWFDVTQEQYAALGYDIQDVNLTHWAYATRAANDFCVSAGFVGGYMNGHQAGNLIGTVCQGNPANPTPAPTAVVRTNFTTGAPGSYFVLSGEQFTPDSKQEIFANGESLGAVRTDAEGKFAVTVSTDFADLGSYWISTAGPSAPTELQLDMAAELRAKDVGTASVLSLTPGKFVFKVHLPVVSK